MYTYIYMCVYCIYIYVYCIYCICIYIYVCVYIYILDTFEMAIFASYQPVNQLANDMANELLGQLCPSVGIWSWFRQAMGVSWNGGTIYKWMVYFMGKPSINGWKMESVGKKPGFSLSGMNTWGWTHVTGKKMKEGSTHLKIWSPIWSPYAWCRSKDYPHSAKAKKHFLVIYVALAVKRCLMISLQDLGELKALQPRFSHILVF